MSNISEYIQNNPHESQRLLGLKHEQLQQLLEKAIELHHQKQQLVESKKIRIILGGGGRKPKLSPSEQIILTLRYLRQLTTFQLRRTTSGTVEGINNKLKLIKRLGYGFRNFNNFRLRSLLHWHFSINSPLILHKTGARTKKPRFLPQSRLGK